MSQQDKGKQSNNYARVKIFNKLSKQIKCLKMDKNQTKKKKKKKYQAASSIGTSSSSSLLLLDG
jgi:hypothetical protein